MASGDTVVKTFYAHGGPESTDEYLDLWPTDAPQQQRAHYILYEDAVDVEIDLDTGQFRYVAFAGVPLAKPTKWMG